MQTTAADRLHPSDPTAAPGPADSLAAIAPDLTTEALRGCVMAIRHAQSLLTEGRADDAQRELAAAADAGQQLLEMLTTASLLVAKRGTPAEVTGAAI